MLRTVEKREARERALRERNREREESEQAARDLLTLEECARRMGVSYSTARRIFHDEPGVVEWLTPGSSRPMVRVPPAVFERVARRSIKPWRS